MRVRGGVNPSRRCHVSSVGAMFIPESEQEARHSWPHFLEEITRDNRRMKGIDFE